MDILGYGEVRWPDSEHCEINNYLAYHSGDITSRNKNGVAMILNKHLNTALMNFIGISGRVAILKINTR